MGLDIYLEHCPPEGVAQEKRFQEAILLKGEDFSLDEYEAAAAGFNLDEYGRSPWRRRISIDSGLYPEHLFKIGYFRSSYNDAGINILGVRYGLPTLYDVLPLSEMKEDEYFVIDWERVLDTADKAVHAWRDYSLSDKAKFGVVGVGHNILRHLSDYEANGEKTALEVFERYRTAMGEMGEVYGQGDTLSCRDGKLFPGGLKVYAAITGSEEQLWETDGDRPAVYLITEPFIEWQWYWQALSIVHETAKWVLSRPDAKDYYLYASS